MSEQQAKAIEISMDAGGALAAALAKAQAQMGGAAKNAINPHFGRKYSDLSAVWDACRGPLTANGIAVIQLPNTSESGVEVITILIHSSGQQMRGRCWLPVSKKDAQGYGSAITYARRYSLAAMVGVVADDDDGNAAVGHDSDSTSTERDTASDEEVARHNDEQPEDGRPVTVKVGRNKGTPLSEINDKELEWQLKFALEQAARNHPKWKKSDDFYLAAVQREVKRRGG